VGCILRTPLGLLLKAQESAVTSEEIEAAIERIAVGISATSSPSPNRLSDQALYREWLRLTALKRVTGSRQSFAESKDPPAGAEPRFGGDDQRGLVYRDAKAIPLIRRARAGDVDANKGQDFRLIQDWLGHRDPKHTSRYTRVAARRFEGVWD
jgi:hypothetical protein